MFIDWLFICWLNGVVEIYEGFGVDQYYFIIEGEGLVIFVFVLMEVLFVFQVWLNFVQDEFWLEYVLVVQGKVG